MTRARKDVAEIALPVTAEQALTAFHDDCGWSAKQRADVITTFIEQNDPASYDMRLMAAKARCFDLGRDWSKDDPAFYVAYEELRAIESERS